MTASDDPMKDPARRSQLDRLLVLVAGHAPIRTAIVHPCDAGSLRGAMEAARMLPHADDPKQWLLALMTDPKQDLRRRVEAARALLPFIHPRPG